MRLWVSYKKNMENNYFCILKVTEERSRFRSWIRTEVRIRIRTKMLRIPTTAWRSFRFFLSLSDIKL
jgi:hypothetical protein